MYLGRCTPRAGDDGLGLPPALPGVPGVLTTAAGFLPQLPVVGGIFKKGLGPPELPGSYAKWQRRDSHQFLINCRPVQVNFAARSVRLEGRFPEGKSNWSEGTEPEFAEINRACYKARGGRWGPAFWVPFSAVATDSRIPADVRPVIQYIIANRAMPAGEDAAPGGLPPSPGAPAPEAPKPPPTTQAGLFEFDAGAIFLALGGVILATQLAPKRRR